MGLGSKLATGALLSGLVFSVGHRKLEYDFRQSNVPMKYTQSDFFGLFKTSEIEIFFDQGEIIMRDTKDPFYIPREKFSRFDFGDGIPEEIETRGNILTSKKEGIDMWKEYTQSFPCIFYYSLYLQGRLYPKKEKFIV